MHVCVQCVSFLYLVFFRITRGSARCSSNPPTHRTSNGATQRRHTVRRHTARRHPALRHTARRATSHRSDRSPTHRATHRATSWRSLETSNETHWRLPIRVIQINKNGPHAVRIQNFQVRISMARFLFMVCIFVFLLLSHLFFFAHPA